MPVLEFATAGRSNRGGALPSVSVVVPTRGRPASVLAIVDRVITSPGVADVVVVMPAGDPAAAVLAPRCAADPRIRCLQLDPPPDAAAARLAGVREARGELLLLLDDDVLPAPEVPLGHARRHAGRSGLVVLGAMPVRLTARRRPGQACQRLYAEEWDRAWAEHHAEPLEALWMGHLSVRRADYLRVEADSTGWDGSYYEDRDLGLRMLAAGLTGVAADELRAEHLQGRDLAGLIRDADRQGRGLVRLARLHPDTEGELPAYVISPPALVALSRLLDHPRLAPIVLRALAGTVQLAGLLHAWKIETTTVRLIRRLATMSAVRRSMTQTGPLVGSVRSPSAGSPDVRSPASASSDGVIGEPT